ncbi:MAG: PEP-utilizing enzyme [Polyangiaceae bacterium]
MWQPLRRFDDPAIPKLHNLARAGARGLRVPRTVWARGREAPAKPPKDISFPLIVRSGSPTEDTHETSNAGQLLSLVVKRAEDFADSVRRVVDALPHERGEALGVVFVQPLVQAREAGIAFFDGFYFERTAARGGNEALTSGKDRGEVTRGHLGRGDAWSEWLSRVHAVFADDIPRIDIEYAEDDDGLVLLQARHALFPIARSETLSLANHKEILGDPPSPWIVSVLVESGREVLDFFAQIDPGVRAWDEAYAIELGERAWMNFSFFFRLMDRWGLPRAFVTQGVGGEGGGDADHALIPGRFLRNSFRLLRLQATSVRTVLDAQNGLAKLDALIGDATSLLDVYRANVSAMGLAIRTNFAIGGVLSGVSRVRRACGVEGTARVVTEEMMHRYQALSSIRSERARARALDEWLAEYGHRGPLESDPCRPRFSELRDLLWSDLSASSPVTAKTSSTSPNGASHARAPSQASSSRTAPEPVAPSHAAPSHAASSAASDDDAGLFFWIDKRREQFRDDLMRRWQDLRTKALACGAALVADGRLDSPIDVFWLRAAEIEAVTNDATFDARAAVHEARARRESLAGVELPLTASRHTITDALATAGQARAAAEGKRVFPGIALSAAVVEGTALCANDLTELLAASSATGGIDGESILIVGALEPSWAVVFPRVRGVVAEIGGELSHASILLREARKPAVVNCKDVLRAIRTGDRVRIDGSRGVVELVNRT